MSAIAAPETRLAAGGAGIPRLRVANICKNFGTLRANDDISLDVMPGEVMCLLGENGAGKSTLMNIVYGLYRADSGRIEIDGWPVTIRSPHEAINHGVGMVHQHFMLVPPLTVTDNIILGTRGIFSRQAVINDLPAIQRRVAEVANRYGLKIDPAARVSSLSVGEQQRVEIVKALYRGVSLLILDEPTAVLTPQETADLFHTLKTLTAAGLAIIFITHKLNEVMAASDRVTVLRDGQVVGQRLTSETTTHELAQLMVGRDVQMTVDKPPAAPGPNVLVIQELTVQNATGRKVLDRLSLCVAAGEIVGIAGVDGNGQSELALAVAGLLKPGAGTVHLGGVDITGKSPHAIIAAGLRHIPEDRHTEGLVLDFSVADNLILKQSGRPPYVRRGVLQKRVILDYAARVVKLFDVRTRSVNTPACDLSGGNQQKVVLGREIDQDPVVLIAAQPTRGLDVGATEFVHNALLAQRARGVAILLISTELEEILALSDRIAVIYEGQIVGEMPGDRANMQKIGLMMAGAQVETRAEA
jgi:general nucleoside transport system ATP-binding protein